MPLDEVLPLLRSNMCTIPRWSAGVLFCCSGLFFFQQPHPESLPGGFSSPVERRKTLRLGSGASPGPQTPKKRPRCFRFPLEKKETVDKKEAVQILVDDSQPVLVEESQSQPALVDEPQSQPVLVEDSQESGLAEALERSRYEQSASEELQEMEDEDFRIAVHNSSVSHGKAEGIFGSSEDGFP